MEGCPSCRRRELLWCTALQDAVRACRIYNSLFRQVRHSLGYSLVVHSSLSKRSRRFNSIQSHPTPLQCTLYINQSTFDRPTACTTPRHQNVSDCSSMAQITFTLALGLVLSHSLCLIPIASLHDAIIQVPVTLTSVPETPQRRPHESERDKFFHVSTMRLSTRKHIDVDHHIVRSSLFPIR